MIDLMCNVRVHRSAGSEMAAAVGGVHKRTTTSTPQRRLLHRKLSRPCAMVTAQLPAPDIAVDSGPMASTLRAMRGSKGAAAAPSRRGVAARAVVQPVAAVAAPLPLQSKRTCHVRAVTVQQHPGTAVAAVRQQRLRQPLPPLRCTPPPAEPAQPAAAGDELDPNIPAVDQDFDLLGAEVKRLQQQLTEQLKGCSIYLIGMMGSGKSTTGKMLANTLQ